MQVALGKEYATGLRLVADFYEAHPELKLPWTQSVDGRTFWVRLTEDEKPTLLEFAKAFGEFAKDSTTETVSITGEFGMLKLLVQIPRKVVCTCSIDI